MPANHILDVNCPAELHSELKGILAGLDISARDYDWFISRTQYAILGEVPDTDLPILGDQWMTGEELDRIISAFRIEFDWAVFSAVPKGTRFEVEKVPYADGNPDFWKRKCRPQLPGALFEIVEWDGCYTLLIGLDEKMAESIRTNYPGVQTIQEHLKESKQKQREKSRIRIRIMKWLSQIELMSRLFPNKFRYFPYEEFLSRQDSLPSISIDLLKHLQQEGVKDTTQLKLDFFFITNSMDKAAALSHKLRSMGYEVEYGHSKPWRTYGATGTTTPIQMDELSLSIWVLKMVRLGYQYDCAFDGWEADPRQPQCMD